MFRENYYTPPQEKRSFHKVPTRDQRSQTFNLHKSSAFKSTQLGSYSPYRSTAVSRLQEVKKTIDSVIVDLNDKRDMNDEAIREIRSVHSELADEFRKNRSVYGKQSTSTFAPELKSHQGSSYDLRFFAPPQDDNIALRGKLNEEMRKNNELMVIVSRLQDQNQYLKQDKQLTFGPMNQARQLQAENESLKRKLSNVAQIPHQFFEQLQELKKQNQKLRKDTVKLLHKVDRII